MHEIWRYISTAKVIENFKIKIKSKQFMISKKNANIPKNLSQCLVNSVSNENNEIMQKANGCTLKNQLSLWSL